MGVETDKNFEEQLLLLMEIYFEFLASQNCYLLNLFPPARLRQPPPGI